MYAEQLEQIANEISWLTFTVGLLAVIIGTWSLYYIRNDKRGK